LFIRVVFNIFRYIFCTGIFSIFLSIFLSIQLLQIAFKLKRIGVFGVGWPHWKFCILGVQNVRNLHYGWIGHSTFYCIGFWIWKSLSDPVFVNCGFWLQVKQRKFGSTRVNENLQKNNQRLTTVNYKNRFSSIMIQHIQYHVEHRISYKFMSTTQFKNDKTRR
jgi:hypothetical protein